MLAQPHAEQAGLPISPQPFQSCGPAVSTRPVGVAGMQLGRGSAQMRAYLDQAAPLGGAGGELLQVRGRSRSAAALPA